MTQTNIIRLCTGASGLAIALSGLALAGSAQAQEASQVQDVVVTGYRASLASALVAKRNADVMVDVINAEDIADFPDANLAESLQRLPGVSIDRENGEGNLISVRGLSGDFTRVRLNGLETLSTAGASNADGALSRGRGFQFSTFASELFSSLKVQKTSEAATDEGSLGATVDLISGRPFNFKGRRLALSLEDAYYPNGKKHNPRLAALASDRFDSDWGEFGVLASVAYNERDQIIDSYVNPAGAPQYAYRGATFNNANDTAGAADNPQGFALPIGSNPATSLSEVTNPEAIGYLIGSDPQAYALINGGSTQGSLVRIPALASLNQRALSQERLGLTAAVQWRPSDRTTVSVDSLYSEFTSISTNYQIGPVGLNRNNTNGNRNPASFSYQTLYTASNNNNSSANRRGAYARCDIQTATDFRDEIDCGQSIYGSTRVFATDPGATRQNLSADQGSFNPNNLEVYDYYNQPGSPGYINTGNPRDLARRGSFIGRPAVRLIDAELSDTGANADYLVMGNIDQRSAVDEGRFTTWFRQTSVQLDQEFTDKLRMTAIYGESSSKNRNQGRLADFIRVDSNQGVPGDEYFTYDDRAGGDMPMIDFGFDVADPANWDFTKGYSALRQYKTNTDNGYQTLRVDFTYDLNDNIKLRFGGGARKFDFYYTRFERLIGDTMNPSLLEGVNPVNGRGGGLVKPTTVAEMGQLVNWGEGLDVPAGTPTSFFTPNLQAFSDRFGFDCDCINDFGDWRLSDLRNGGTNTFWVTEKSHSYYGQIDFDGLILDRELRGNFGVRYAVTDPTGRGRTPTGVEVTDTYRYDNFLPSVNLVYSLRDDLILRFGAAKAMARPQLSNLNPGITNFTVPSQVGGVAPFDGANARITLGNTRLKPFISDNYDLSLEWYFAPDAVASVAVFRKNINSFPQVVLSEGPLSGILNAEAVANLRSTFDDLTTDTAISQRAYIDADEPFQIRSYRDAPGGSLEGIELSYQQNLTFLPGFLKNVGVQANYTYIDSSLTYILDPATNTLGDAPFLGASPNAFNLTVFYDADRWTARLSSAYRAEYKTTYPLAGGSCDPGVCDSPLINDFVSSDATFNLDASFTYKLTPHVTLTAEALNLTDQADIRYGYDADPIVSSYSAPGRQFFVGARFVY